MNRKILILSAILIMFIFAGEITVYADWVQQSDAQYYYLSDGKMCKNGLFRIGDIMYRFDESGKCLGEYTGWTVLKRDKSKKKYYENGRCCADMWVKIDGKYYYFYDYTGYFSGEVRDEIMILKNPYVSYKDRQMIVTFTMENPTNEIVWHSPLFELEYLEGENWMPLKLKDDYGWHSETIGVVHGECEIEINAAEQYGKLSDGTYRVVYYLGDDKIVSDTFLINNPER